MKKTITVNDQPIRFMVSGKGDALVLLHGFTESLEIWEDFSSELEKEYRVIAIDLPGHGHTGVFGSAHSMEFMADVVKLVLDHLEVTSCVMIGHSMGGYVTLAFAGKYPALLKGFGLFHSHAGTDSEEARKNRVRTINIVYSNRMGFIQEFIPGLFAAENIPRFGNEIEQLKQLAQRPPPEGITAALRGMMEREDFTNLLRRTEIPVLFIAGAADSRIPLNLVFQQASLVGHAEILILGKAGHMGFIEEHDKSLQTIRYFAKKAFDLKG